MSQNSSPIKEWSPGARIAVRDNEGEFRAGVLLDWVYGDCLVRFDNGDQAWFAASRVWPERRRPTQSDIQITGEDGSHPSELTQNFSRQFAANATESGMALSDPAHMDQRPPADAHVRRISAADEGAKSGRYSYGEGREGSPSNHDTVHPNAVETARRARLTPLPLPPRLPSTPEPSEVTPVITITEELLVEPEILVDPEALVEPEILVDPEALVEPEILVDPEALVEPAPLVPDWPAPDPLLAAQGSESLELDPRFAYQPAEHLDVAPPSTYRGLELPLEEHLPAPSRFKRPVLWALLSAGVVAAVAAALYLFFRG